MSFDRLEARVAELERKVAELYRRMGEPEPEFGASAAANDERVIDAIRRGAEIEAIKLYRGITGVGLAEAKQAIDEIARLHKPIG